MTKRDERKLRDASAWPFQASLQRHGGFWSNAVLVISWGLWSPWQRCRALRCVERAVSEHRRVRDVTRVESPVRSRADSPQTSRRPRKPMVDGIRFPYRGPGRFRDVAVHPRRAHPRSGTRNRTGTRPGRFRDDIRLRRRRIRVRFHVQGRSRRGAFKTSRTGRRSFDELVPARIAMRLHRGRVDVGALRGRRRRWCRCDAGRSATRTRLFRNHGSDLGGQLDLNGFGRLHLVHHLSSGVHARQTFAHGIAVEVLAGPQGFVPTQVSNDLAKVSNAVVHR